MAQLWEAGDLGPGLLGRATALLLSAAFLPEVGHSVGDHVNGTSPPRALGNSTVRLPSRRFSCCARIRRRRPWKHWADSRAAVCALPDLLTLGICSVGTAAAACERTLDVDAPQTERVLIGALVALAHLPLLFYLLLSRRLARTGGEAARSSRSARPERRVRSRRGREDSERFELVM